MSGIARLLQLKGERVSGCDIKRSFLTEKLCSLGADIFYEHSPSHIEGVDILVYSSAIPEDCPEIKEAKARAIPIMKRAQILAEITKDKTCIAIAGSHGKTTTTSLASYLLKKGGLSPTAAIGGIVVQLQENAWWGDSSYFLLETDESDGSFLYFHPHYIILTNIDYEHLDYFQDWEGIFSAFGRFIEQMDKEGTLYYCKDDPNINKILNGYKKKTFSFGLSSTCDLYAREIQINGFSSSFQCIYKGKNLGEVTLSLPGRHNISNALGVIALSLELGMDFAKIKEIIEVYQGTRRRFQIKGELSGITVVEDYGHHPTEIKAVLQTIREAGKFKRIIVVFQPHRYTRTKFLLEEFGTCFSPCEHLFITDIYSATEEPIVGINSLSILEKVKQSGKDSAYYLAKEKIISHLLGIIRPLDLVLFLGAGDIGSLSDELVKELKEGIYQEVA